MSINGPIGFGIIGLGEIYRLAHSLAYVEGDGLRATAVCDLDPSLVAQEAAKVGAQGYTDYRELLADPAVDAIDLVLPHNLHYRIAREALLAGKHVLVEKPMTLESETAAELMALADAQGLHFTVNENTRFVPGYAAVQRLLAENAIGDVTLVRTLISGNEFERLNDTKLWKGRRDGSGGGTIVDAGAHSFYLLKWLFGEIATLQAHGEQIVEESEVEDWAVVVGRMKSGALFSTEFTFTSGGPWNERLEVHGSEGLIVIDQHQNPPAMLYRGKRDHEGTPIESVAYEPRTWKYQSIAAGITDFAATIREGRPPSVAPGDGAYAVRMIELAYQSVEQQRRLAVT